MAGCKPDKLSKTDSQATYTCNEYRAEMILLSLQRRLGSEDLTEAERRAIESEIDQLKTEMGMV